MGVINCMSVILIILTRIVPIHSYLKPTMEDVLEVKRKTAGIKEDFLKFILDEQLLYCPRLDMCSLTGRSVDWPGGIQNIPCCSQPPMFSCQCNISHPSSYDLLCPDVRDQKLSCIRPQLRRFNNLNWNDFVFSSKSGYLMISYCPATLFASEKRLDQLCRVLTPDGHVKPPTVADQLNIAVYTPVTNQVTNVTYRNIYCAMCNKENVSDLYPWTAEVKCHHKFPIFETSVSKVLERVIFEKDHNCNILFDTEKRSSLMKCSPKFIDILECNVTGLWKMYDANVERACHFYRSPYMQTYRNVFCAMCNGVQELSVTCRIEDFMKHYLTKSNDIQGIFPLLNLTRVVSVELSKTMDKCPAQAKYNTLQERFQEIICNPPLIYRDSTCEGLYESLKSQTYAVFITSSARNNIAGKTCTEPGNCSYDKYSSLYKGFVNYVIKYLLTYPSVVQCNTQVAAERTIRVDSVIVMEVPTTFVVSSIFMVQNEVHNEVVFVKKFLEGIRGTLYTITFENQSLTFDVDVAPRGQFTTERSGLTDNFHNKYLPFSSRTGLITRCYLDMTPFQITSSLMCPMVNISYKDVQYSNLTLCITDMEVCFNQSQFENHGSYFLVCEEPYFQRIAEIVKAKTKNIGLTNYNKNNSNATISRLLVVFSCICMLVAFCYSLLGFPYTMPLSILQRVLLCSLFLLNVAFVCEAFLVHDHKACKSTGYVTSFACVFAFVWLEVCFFHILSLSYRLSIPARRLSISYKRCLCYFCYAFGNAFIVVLINFLYFQQSVVDTFLSESTVPTYCHFIPSYIFLYTLFTPLSCHVVACLLLVLVTVYVNFERNQQLDNDFVKQTRDVFRSFCKIAVLLTCSLVMGTCSIYLDWTGYLYIFFALNSILAVYCMLSSVCIYFRGRKREDSNRQGSERFTHTFENTNCKSQLSRDLSELPTEITYCSHF